MRDLTFGSVCSGIEAASVAFKPAGWRAAWLSEIDPNANLVLKHHYPDIPNHGDMTKLPELIRSGQVEAPDVLCGGTPCQAFSVAGLRGSLGDARGALTLTFCEIANEIDARRRDEGKAPTIVVWENVVGALSVSDNAFGCLLGALAGEEEPLEPSGGRWSHAGCVYGPDRAIAWRVLNAQHFGVAQRRRRLIVVACPIERAHPSAILFEFESGSGYLAPSRRARQADESDPAQGAGEHGAEQPRGGVEAPDCPEQAFAVANTLTRRMYKGINTTMDEGQTPVITFPANLSGTQCASAEDVCCSIGAKNPTAIADGVVVRRLLPIEAERLQGFPDNYTDVPGMSDTTRYMGLGNSWAVPVFTWLAHRINDGIRE